jgi:molybdate transport system substrate-binding protein
MQPTLTVLSAGIVEHRFERIADAFRQATQHDIAVRFSPGRRIVEWIEAGEAADVVLVSTGPQMARLLANGHVRRETLLVLGRAVIGIAVPVDAPGPDIGTPAALRAALLAAARIARGNPGGGSSSGIHAEEVLRRLDIFAEVVPRLVGRDRGQATIRLVAEGLADLAIGQATEIAAVEGVRFLGPLPETLQAANEVAAAATAAASRPDLAAAFLRVLDSEEVRTHLRGIGLAPA